MKRIIQKIQSIIENTPSYIPYFCARFFGQPYWEISIDDTTIKLFFLTRQHYHFAKAEHDGEMEHDLLRKWLSLKGSVIYDIGGYNGIYGLLAAKAHPDAQVTIFEPDRTNARHVEINIRKNNLKNCTCVRAAVTDHDGFVSFSQGGRTKEHIVENGYQVTAYSLTSLPKADLIKLDVEGAEGRVLSRLAYLATILLELHDDAFLLRYGDTQESVLRIIEEKGLTASLLGVRAHVIKHYLLTPR
jgi:FkbM family methyltransferase